MPSWPSQLPQRPIADGYNESLQSQVIRTQMDAGPAKSRRRFTAAARMVTARYVLTTSQVAAFEAWFVSDIGAGALAFDWPHRSGTISARITGDPPYRLSPLGGELWRLDMTLEVLP